MGGPRGRGAGALGGGYLRLADGTQFCWHALTSNAAAPVSWSYPVVTGSCTSGGAQLLSVGRRV
ncbi:hypothetical protein [Alloyangia pacifica]|uniref:hypothetical protein n=1 Tax=Alloyangia pacifica TaxID=311180 RepID=UPI001CD7D865|nr:hypothetical protein [Alloyangia pacifica]MCA0998657.1 hypothetical protein [Alloyangia pacifica]